MDRQIIYPGQIPLDTDLMNTNKYAMTAIAKLVAGVLGTQQVVNGLAVTQTTVPSMNVTVAAGEIYSSANMDSTSYGSLAADTTHQVMKQGILMDAVNLSCPAPGTVGFSINYLIQAAFNEVDTGAVALPYYNASNPSLAWSGPSNSGTPQATTRQNQCVVTVKAGAAATTGTQATPSPDAGNVGLSVVTVAYGAANIVNANIVQYVGASLVPQLGLASNVAHAIYSKSVSGNADVTLTAQEAAYPILTLTGALTGNINLIVPAVSRQRVINNQTSGAFQITVKTAAGTGVVVTQGYALPLYCDGTNVLSSVSALLTQAQADARYGSDMFSVSASVSANALTVGLNNSAKINFRSATLASGTANVRVISASLSLVVPTGATLGTVAATSARLVLLAIDNAGTVELAITNLSGGLNLDETTLITTTAISAAATAANVIYSTTARAGVPFRVVGFIDITEAVAGTWATAPTTVQGMGGQALATASSLGYGQTWQDLTASRVSGTTYTNTTGKPIAIAANCTTGNITAAIVGGVTIAAVSTINLPNATFIVPPGQTYSITATSTFNKWAELR